MSLSTVSNINSISIPLLLDWWQQRKKIASIRSNLHGTLPKNDEAYLSAYYRLMEVYSVVKSGGVKAQIEATRAFAEREVETLHQRLVAVEAAATLAEGEKQREKEKIQKELSDLHSANDWRLKTLMNIAPDEEAIVEQHLPDIERTLMPVKCA